ncbi:hypothetical protein [Actinomadura verrucosospora]|uniref:Uncharacterized protein n=1 Tax=Actinomadura verrucosospora TaxID=46165 RepID=A0A7D3VXR5_ACTVE|nr:hypothetical protein [Actinomadura verrucosospora]QKG21352.1 hypothetical protein ACTIVE_2990 [Actinomadura verrucosospora]
MSGDDLDEQIGRAETPSTSRISGMAAMAVATSSSLRRVTWAVMNAFSG